MANLQRYTQKIFGSASNELGQFGSAIAGTKVKTSDVETLQSLQAYLDGWKKAIITNKNYPTWQEMDGVLYGITYQIAYMFQNGIPEYDDGTEYKQTSIVKESGTYKLYGSLIDNNTGNPLTDTNSWQFLIDLSDLQISQYTKFAINKGATPLLIDNSNELAFDIDNSKPLTYTNINGETVTVDSFLPIDVSNVTDGEYKVALPQSSNQPYLFDGEIYIQDNEVIPEFQKKFTNYNFYVENNYIKLDNGSVVAFPDGVNVDGSKKFIYETISAQSFIITTWGNGTAMPCIRKYGEDNFGFYTYFENQWFNQTTQPTTVGAWYNPDTNIIKFSDDGITWNTVNVSFPVGRAVFTNGTGFTSLIETYQTPQVLWINPQEMYAAQLTDKTIGYGSWQDYNNVLLLDSSVTVSSGVISALEQPTYNYNGIGLNQSSKTNKLDIINMCLPDYHNPVQGVTATNIWKTVSKTSLVMLRILGSGGSHNTQVNAKDENGNLIGVGASPSDLRIANEDGYGNSAVIVSFVLQKNYSYMFTTAGASFNSCLEFPLKGVE